MKHDPASLKAEIDAAIKVRDSFLYTLEEQVKRYHQPAYRQDCEDETYEPENHAYEANALNVAQMAFNNPRVVCKPGRPGAHRMVSQAVQHGLNRWSEKSKFREPVQQVTLDTQFAFGAFMVNQAPIPGYKPGGGGDQPVPHWPVCERLSQWQFFFDPLCMMFRRARYAGHVCPYDKETLIELAEQMPEEGWNAELLRECGTTKDFEGRDEKIRDEVPDRGEIKTYEMWVPDYDLPESAGPDEGYFGTIFTLVDGGAHRDEWIRVPRPAYVPRTGPYVLAGMYMVPDLAFPLAPLVAVEGQVREFNAHAGAMSVQMKKYRRLILVASDRTDLIQKMNSSNNLVIPVQGLRKDEVIEFEVGGVTEQHIAMRTIMRERLDRNSGITDAQRGNASGGTATANAIADEASTIRMGWMKQRIGEAVRQVFEKVGEFMLRDDRVVFPLGEDAAGELGMTEPWFYGGPVEGMEPVSMDDLDIILEPYSMDQMGQGVIRQQFMESLQLFTSLVPMVRQFPEVKWKDLFNKIGDINNDPEWGNMLDADLAGMLGGMQGALPETPKPQMAGTLSRGARAGVQPIEQAAPVGMGAGLGGAPEKGQQRGGQSGKRATVGRVA